MSTVEAGSGLFSKTREAVLAALVMATEPELHVRELARRTGLDATGVLRELRRLEKHGLALSRLRGGQRLFRMNAASPIYPELAAIVRKTAGLADVVRGALRSFEQDIELAYIYGSQAAGSPRPESDVDVMLVGRLSSVDAYAALEDAATALGRAVNPTVYSSADYWEKVKLGRGFPFTAHSGPRIMLLGEPHGPA